MELEFLFFCFNFFIFIFYYKNLSKLDFYDVSGHCLKKCLLWDHETWFSGISEALSGACKTWSGRHIFGSFWTRKWPKLVKFQVWPFSHKSLLCDHETCFTGISGVLSSVYNSWPFGGWGWGECIIFWHIWTPNRAEIGQNSDFWLFSQNVYNVWPWNLVYGYIGGTFRCM